MPGVTNSEGARGRVRPHRGRAGHLGRVRRRAIAAPATPSPPPRWPAGHRDAARLRLLHRRACRRPRGPRRDRPQRRRAGGGPARTRPARDRASCRWSTTRASPAACSAICSGAINGAAVARGTSFLQGPAGQAHFRARHHGPRRPAPRARPALPPVRRRGRADRAARPDRGRRADHLAAGQPQRPAARPAHHRPRGARHRRPALAGAEQRLSGSRARSARPS